VVSELPGYVDVRLSGLEGVVRGLNPKDVSAFISLKGAAEGDVIVYLSPSNIKVPSNITISQVSPVEIKLRLDTIAEKPLPVKPVVSGRPVKGYHLLGVQVEPESVMVAGPRSSLNRLDIVSTQMVDIEGINAGFEKTVFLEPPPVKGVKLEEDHVRVTVSVSRNKQ